MSFKLKSVSGAKKRFRTSKKTASTRIKHRHAFRSHNAGVKKGPKRMRRLRSLGTVAKADVARVVRMLTGK